VITEDRQRIVGIQIPPDNVGAVLRSIGLTRDLRKPDEIFYAVLDEGDEITLASNLKLRRGSIHSEPAIELSGADPYQFGELRELGLINEQINWKQRFFVPTDDTRGIEILLALLARYPMVVGEEGANETEANLAELATQRQMTPTNVIDLDQWIIAAHESNSEKETVNEIDPQLEGETLALEVAAAAEELPAHESEEAVSSILTKQSAAMPWLGQAASTTQLAFEFA
jgi:hypothetical protein